MSKRNRVNRIGRNALVAVVLAAILAGCSGLPPIYPTFTGSTYKVRKGDTLYSIAFRYGLDYKSLARINGIRPPYTIFIDQVIRLRGSARIPEKDSGPATTKPPVQKAPPVPRVPDAPVKGWRWPLPGKVVAEYSLKRPVNKGIDIAGRIGDSVAAAADGVVVYAGGNLRGYGQLVILKHNDNFLSAYGNNERLLVKEGEKVRAGRSIARVGKSAADVEMLHFEIRRDGKPVDPRKYLPSR